VPASFSSAGLTNTSNVTSDDTEARQAKGQLAVVSRRESKRLARLERHSAELNGGQFVEERLDEIARAHRHTTRGQQDVSRCQTMSHRVLLLRLVVQGVRVPCDLGARFLGGGDQRVAVAVAHRARRRRFAWLDQLVTSRQD
jgi:hypothetical protein